MTDQAHQAPSDRPTPGEPALGERAVFMHPQAQPEAPDRDLFGKAPTRHRDWSHRRGEPRVLTLLWMVYLMSSTVIMFSSMATAYSISPDITRPAARSMLVIVAIGFSVLWPMVRFSQHPPESGCVRAALRDAVVVFIPLQAVLWPQAMPVLAGWPVIVVASLSALCMAWTIILAGVIALGTSSIARNGGGEPARILWMIVAIVVVFAAPVVGGLTGMGATVPVAQPRVGWLLSPISGLLELVGDRRQLGVSARIFPEHWQMIAALLCVGAALLLIARAVEVARARFSA